MVKYTFAKLIAKMCLLIGKLALVIGNVMLSIQIMKHWEIYNKIGSPMTICVIIGILTYMTVSTFLDLFTYSVQALLTCLAIDLDMHNGVPKHGPPTFHDKVQKIKDSPEIGDNYSKIKDTESNTLI